MKGDFKKKKKKAHATHANWAVAAAAALGPVALKLQPQDESSEQVVHGREMSCWKTQSDSVSKWWEGKRCLQSQLCVCVSKREGGIFCVFRTRAYHTLNI